MCSSIFPRTVCRAEPWYVNTRNAGAQRPDAYELAQAYVAANSYNVTVITVTVDGNAQNS